MREENTIHQKIHQQIIENCDELNEWFKSKTRDLKFSIYTSYDIRDSGWKVSPVDANIFPAGFNNICDVDKEAAGPVMSEYLQQTYGKIPANIALLTEEHTSNLYYWDNVYAIRTLLESTGSKVTVCIARPMAEPLQLQSAAGHSVTIYSAESKAGKVIVNGIVADLVVSNNDFSVSYQDWIAGMKTPINPPYAVGWHSRKKSTFFTLYNELSAEFARKIKMPEVHFQVATEVFENFDANDVDRRQALADRVDQFLRKTQSRYKELNISDEPFCFLKNNSGTYGLAVLRVKSAQQILEWSAKDRKKMKAAKGGREVSEVIIQEGIHTRIRTDDGITAEPCIYMIGEQLVGGFLRSHSEKGSDENLNSPGAIFKKLCMADLQHDMSDCPLENVYGWVSKLAAISVAQELKQVNG